MSVSIVIPTRNAEKYIENLIEKLQIQTIPYYELCILDTESVDSTMKIVNKFQGIKVLTVKELEFDHGGTRNLGAANTTGDFLIFLTQDAIPQNEFFIENLLKPFENPNVAAVYGRQIAQEKATPLEKITREYNYPDRDIVKSSRDVDEIGIKAFFFSDVCSAFRRKEFEAYGGFHENIIVNEDMFMAFKIIKDGKLTAYASKATVIHSHAYTYLQQFKRNFDIGVFLKQNSELLNHAKTESEGEKYIKYTFGILWNEKSYFWIYRFIIESIFKLMGYKLGLCYKQLPPYMIEKFSMHKNYWYRNSSKL